MLDLLNALAAVAAVTIALTLTSLDRPVAMLLGLTGSTTGSFLAWVSAPGAWEHSLLLPWAAAVVGTVAVVAGWSAVRAYSGLFGVPSPTDGAADDRELVPAER
ncbi:hypothetical protein DEJ28_00360 [Curtobacterium sp. MCPF17_002]|uniref:hypothetical protein n=1 Tax=Curtobacterium sp. MCPF17_002 TaxID=2175645 RepID=UPI000DA8B18C|nr:hypothetical protein [Curtobacterium sp. MCPF17_002]WIB77581.1 hypothetical protein DEJ28_00360 [Curtobacterium sp. MCPF17_002]